MQSKGLQFVLVRCRIMNVRDALHSYLNLAEATKIRLHAEIETPVKRLGSFRI